MWDRPGGLLMPKHHFGIGFVLVFLVSTGLALFGADGKASGQANASRLKPAYRFERSKWIYVHLEGSPADIGYQHGYLLAPEIDTSIQAVSYLLQHDTHRNWEFYRSAARNFLWPKLEQEYKDE